MKNWSVLAAVMLVVALCPYSAQGIDRKKKEVQPKTTKVVLGKYDKLFKNKAHVVAKGGFMTLHKVDGKLFFEMPLKYMGREFLLASTVTSATDNSICVVGYKPRTPRHIKFTLLDSMVCLRNVNSKMTYDKGQAGLEEAMEKNFGDPIVESYRVLAYTPDSSAVVFDMTDMFTKDESSLSPIMPNSGGILSHSASLNKEGSMLTEIKAFEDNVSIKSVLSYLVTTKAMGMLTVKKDDPLTTRVTRTLLLLPENKMRPRITDSRLGIFLGNKVYVSMEEDGIQKYSVANRWRLEPKDMDAWKQGKLVEPVKPIVYYLDNTFPESWKEPLREGILRWNTAFEKIGFKNVVQVRDFPLDDPEFDPDNLKYSCVRYIPSTTANAMGPSWVDPSTGEIINASVLIYNDVIRLINGWRFVQTAQVDPRVRAKKMPDDVVKESLAYVIAHEVGHTLGLMHNMRASYSIPVDSLRSPAFTAKYGTTTSIMDYARNNYVAQPEDKNVRLIPPLLGVYDIFMIKLGYAPIYDAETPADEYATLNKWIQEKAGDPMYTYGEQQILGTLDPASQSESLGDDAVKASRYGIKNLRYIMDHLVEWSAIENRPYDQTSELYYELTKQYQRYMGHCMAYIGGLYLNHPVAGDEQKGFVPVSREKQKEVVKFFFDEFKEQPKWMAKKEIMTLFEPNNDMVANLQANLLRNLLNSSTLGKVGMNAKYSERPYTQKEYLNDLYQGVWNKTEQGKALDYYDRNLQYAYVQYLLKELELTKDAEKSKGLSLELLTEDHLPCYCYEYHRHARQMSANTKISDLGISSKTLYYGQLVKLKELLKNRRHSASGDDKVHYDYLYFELNSALK